MRFWVVSRLEFTERSVCSAVIAAVLVSKLDIDLSLDSTMNGFWGTYRIRTGTTGRHHAFGPGMHGRPIRRVVPYLTNESYLKLNNGHANCAERAKFCPRGPALSPECRNVQWAGATSRRATGR